MKKSTFQEYKKSYESNLHLTKFLKHVFTEIELHPTSMSSTPLTSSFASHSQVDNFFVLNIILWSKYVCIHAGAYKYICVYIQRIYLYLPIILCGVCFMTDHSLLDIQYWWSFLAETNSPSLRSHQLSVV